MLGLEGAGLQLDHDAAAQPHVVATHDIGFATSRCTRFIKLERGRIVLDRADAREIRQRQDEG